MDLDESTEQIKLLIRGRDVRYPPEPEHIRPTPVRSCRLMDKTAEERCLWAGSQSFDLWVCSPAAPLAVGDLFH